MTPCTIALESWRRDQKCYSGASGFPFFDRCARKARIVEAYDSRLVGMVITPRYVGESRAESVRRDGYKLVRAPELEALRLPDVSYDLGAYARIWWLE